MNIILDFDGTILNSKRRLYELFQQLFTLSDLSFEEYWIFKQAGISNQEILSREFGLSVLKQAEFTKNWMELIETEKFLDFDLLFSDAKKALTELASEYSLHLCTARQNEKAVSIQLQKFGIIKLFDNVLVTKQKMSKKELIEQNIIDIDRNDWLVGDTGEDIKVGKSLGIRTCVVTCGFLSREILELYQPELIINSVGDFSSFLK
ncbi:HAD family hydrolase [Shewanella baltica]|uniref:HAD family hydrolase n=1 Tax=Shewanella baltica TaxID=62322 RepID=UPI003D794AA1